MARFFSTFCTAACVGGLFVMSAGLSYGQARAAAETKGVKSETVVEIRSLEGVGPRGRVRTPVYTSDVGGRRLPPAEWAQLTVTYDSAPEWIDEIAFQFFALLMKDERGKREYSLFRGTATCIDVPKGRRHESVAYLRPTALLRYGEVAAVAVEIMVKGQSVGVQSQTAPGVPNLPKEWWKDPHLSARDGYLLNKQQTPFAFVNYDDYDTVK